MKNAHHSLQLISYLYIHSIIAHLVIIGNRPGMAWILVVDEGRGNRHKGCTKEERRNAREEEESSSTSIMTHLMKSSTIQH